MRNEKMIPYDKGVADSPLGMTLDCQNSFLVFIPAWTSVPRLELRRGSWISDLEGPDHWSRLCSDTGVMLVIVQPKIKCYMVIS